MRYSYALPALAALASQVIAAPVVVTNTEVVYVTADPVTATAEPTSSFHPQVGGVLQVVVSKLVQVSGDNTQTFTSTYTTEVPAPTASTATTSVSPASVPAASTTETSTPIPTTTILAPSTTSTTPVTTSATPTTTSATPTTTSTTPTTTSTSPTTTSTSTTPTTTSTSATSTATATSEFASAILAEHNAKRALHGVSDLTWSSTLASYAQDYADNYDCSGTLTHSGGPYGENLGLGYSTTGVVDAWYSEISEYDYSNPSASHFTQVVWKSTTELGCGYTSCGSYWGQYTICSYKVAGNVAGEYSENVLALV